MIENQLDKKNVLDKVSSRLPGYSPHPFHSMIKMHERLGLRGDDVNSSEIKIAVPIWFKIATVEGIKQQNETIVTVYSKSKPDKNIALSVIPQYTEPPPNAIIPLDELDSVKVDDGYATRYHYKSRDIKGKVNVHLLWDGINIMDREVGLVGIRPIAHEAIDPDNNLLMSMLTRCDLHGSR